MIQVGYERYANKISIKQKRAIFKICKNNIRNHPFNLEQPRHYDLSKMICFKNIGDDFGRVQHIKVIINNNLSYDNYAKITLANDEEFDVIEIDFRLSDKDLSETFLNIQLVLELKNTMNYCYRQIIYMNFKKDNNIWLLNSYDWEVIDEKIKDKFARYKNTFMNKRLS